MKLAKTTLLALISFIMLTSCGKSETAKPAAEGIKMTSYNEALDTAKKSGKVIIVDFYAEWCVWCKRFEEDVLSKEDIIKTVNAKFVMARVDLENKSDKIKYKGKEYTSQEFATLMKVEGIPTLVFFDKDENVLSVMTGYYPEKSFKLYLEYIQSGDCKKITFDQYISKRESK